MKIISYTFAAFAIISIIWRLLSHVWNLPLPSWLHWLVELDNPFTPANKAPFIIKHLELQPSMNVLDAGCGPGRLTLPLAKAIKDEGEVTALDIQEAMLQKVKTKMQAKGLQNIRFLQSTLGEKTLENNYYDRVVLATVLGEIPQKEKALKELFHALKPGGILSITEVIFDCHFQRKSKLRKLAKLVGFEESKYVGNPFAFNLHFQKPHSNL